MENFKFDKRLLNQNDIENIITALSGFESLIQDTDIQLTLQKVRAMHHLELSPNFDFSFYQWTGRDSLSADIALIRHSISNHYLLAFEYVDKNGKTSTREIEPYKIYYREQYWYIHGYDRQKFDFRLFKVTRVSISLKQKSSVLE